MAIPRLAPFGRGVGIALPRPLPSDIARLVRAMFKDPAAGLDPLDGNPLIGHILADRYLSAAGHSTPDQLRDWLARFPTLPDATAIHALLIARLPRPAVAPAAPTLAPFAAAPGGDDVESTDRLLQRSPAIDRAVRDATRDGQTDRAIRLIERTRGLSPEYGALLRAEVARALFSQGRDLDALTVAERANDIARGRVGLAPWIGGLAAWRLGRFELARTLFEASYNAPIAAATQRSGAAFWAARASLVLRGDRGPWLYRAAKDGRTFYGLLARRILDQSIRASDPFIQGVLTEADIEAVQATDRGLRAFMLIQVDQPARAAAELRQLFTETREQPGYGRSILLVARAAGLKDLASQLGAVMQPASVHLPATKLRPAGGFVLDPAVVYALARLESNFNPVAVSRSGAQGILQVMPTTAQFIMAGTGIAPQLHNPASNLDVGQRLLVRLAAFDVVGDNLIRLLAAYNAGAGTFGRWVEAMPRETDPLLFIESLPGEETRVYVPRALAYTWLYAAELGLPSSSLDELAAGLWPRLIARPAHPDARPTIVRLH